MVCKGLLCYIAYEKGVQEDYEDRINGPASVRDTTEEHSSLQRRAAVGSSQVSVKISERLSVNESATVDLFTALH